MKKHAFTFIELLVSISIIAILATLVLARYSQKKKDANMAFMKESVRSISNAAETYRSDYDAVISVGGSNVSTSTSLSGTPAPGSTTFLQIFSGTKSNTAGSASYATKVQKTPSTDYTFYYESANYTGVDVNGNPVYGTANVKTANANCFMIRATYVDPGTAAVTELGTMINGTVVNNTTIDCRL